MSSHGHSHGGQPCHGHGGHGGHGHSHGAPSQLPERIVGSVPFPLTDHPTLKSISFVKLAKPAEAQAAHLAAQKAMAAGLIPSPYFPVMFYTHPTFRVKVDEQDAKEVEQSFPITQDNPQKWPAPSTLVECVACNKKGAEGLLVILQRLAFTGENESNRRLHAKLLPKYLCLSCVDELHEEAGGEESDFPTSAAVKAIAEENAVSLWKQWNNLKSTIVRAVQDSVLDTMSEQLGKRGVSSLDAHGQEALEFDAGATVRPQPAHGGHGHSHGGKPCHGHGDHGHSHGAAATGAGEHGHSHGDHGHSHGAAAAHGHSHNGQPCHGHGNHGHSNPLGESARMTCNSCGTTGAHFSRCARCRMAIYCSRDCQTKDWPNHKAICKQIAAAQAAQGHGHAH